MFCHIADKTSALPASLETSACTGTSSDGSPDMRSRGKNGSSSRRTGHTPSNSSSNGANLRSISLQSFAGGTESHGKCVSTLHLSTSTSLPNSLLSETVPTTPPTTPPATPPTTPPTMPDGRQTAAVATASGAEAMMMRKLLLFYTREEGD